MNLASYIPQALDWEALALSRTKSEAALAGCLMTGVYYRETNYDYGFTIRYHHTHARFCGFS
jgi:hypothetical protein